MSELEQTGNQPQEAATESTTAATQPFWEQMDETPAQQIPEPSAEAEPEATEPEVVETEPEVETEDANWLPNEQQKVFPDDVLAKYAKRYGRTLEQLQADPQLKQMIQDKINSDIYIAELQTQQQEDDTEAGEPTPVAVAPQTPQERTQWLEQLVTQAVDQKTVEQFGQDFLVAAGVDPKDPNNADVLKNSGAIGKVLTRGAADLLTTIMPQLQSQMLESAMPGITEMYQRNLYALQWERASSEIKDGNLPKYGTPEFQQAVKTAAAQFPGFERMVFTDAQGHALPPHQQIREQYAFLAKHMSGQKVTPQAVKAALDTGKRIVKDADRSRAAGKVLGAGQGNKQFTQANPKDDFASMIAEYNDSQRSTPLKG